ncbi:MAG: hypothetical protein M5U34_19480 [Chloroflexi bacterium]|nr:hypothetical protein [Chloroflexota bacterium]
MTSVGIVSTGTYSPDGYLTSADIAEATGFPEWVVPGQVGHPQKSMWAVLMISPTKWASKRRSTAW